MPVLVSLKRVAVVLVAFALGSGCSGGGGAAPKGGSGGSGGSGPTLDCHGQVSGAVTGTIDYCAQTASTEQASGKVTRGFITTIDTDHDMNALFSFASEPPAPGSYDYTRFADFQVTVDVLTWSATWDARFDPAPTGNLTLTLTGGSGTALTGSLHATAPATAGLGGSGEVTVDITFP